MKLSRLRSRYSIKVEDTPHSSKSILHSLVFRSIATAALVAVPVTAFAISGDNGDTPSNANETQGSSAEAGSAQNTVSSDTSTSFSSDGESTHSTTRRSSSVSSQVTSNTSDDGQTSTSVTVNGQQLTIPADGELHKVINDDNGTTVVNVSGNSNSATDSSSSVSIEVNSDSSQ